MIKAEAYHLKKKRSEENCQKNIVELAVTFVFEL